MTLDNGTDGQTDRRTDRRTDRQTDRRTERVRRNMRPPPREEGRIIRGVRVNQVQPSNCFRRLEKLDLPSIF